MVRAFADGRPCWVKLLPTSGTAEILRPPEDTPSLVTGDVVRWTQAAGMRVIEQVIERAHPYVYAVDYWPVAPSTVRSIRKYLERTGEGHLVGVRPGRCMLYFAQPQTVPEELPSGVQLRVEPQQEAALFHARRSTG